VTRLTVNRAIEDWLNRPLTRHDCGAGDQDRVTEVTERRQLIGAIGRTGYRIMLELDDRLAERLLGQINEALADPELHDAKRGAIEQTRAQLLEAFPDLV
jgi:hypothetical protein